MNNASAKKNTSMDDDKAPEETLRKQVNTMIANQGWAAIIRMLKEEEEKEEEDHQSMTAPNDYKYCIVGMIDKNVTFSLLTKKDNEDAKALLLLLVALGGKKFVMRKHTFAMGSDKYFGTLLHAACLYNASIDVISTLIDVGGRALVRVKNRCGSNALHYACRFNAPIDVVSTLVDVGGRALVREIEYSGWSSLGYAISNNASIDVVSELLEVGGKRILMDQNSLRIVLKNNSSVDVLSKLLEVGGKELLMVKDRWGWTSLHIALENNASIDLISKLVEVGGKELVMEKNARDCNSLHYALRSKASIDVVLKLLEVGGKELVIEKSNDSLNTLQYACIYEVSIDVVLKLVEVGGKALVMEKNNRGQNPLHIALENSVPIDIISKLVDVGEEALVMEKDSNGCNALHYAYITVAEKVFHNDEDTLLEEELVSLLTEHGGAEILAQTDNSGKTPLQHLITNEDILNSWGQERMERYYRRMGDSAAMLIGKGIELQVEGEYGIGGLFSSSSSQKNQDKIYENWDEIVLPALEQVMSLPHNRNLPILQALMVNKAPTNIVKSTIGRFSASINTADSFARYPIDVAVSYGLAWDDGMKEILERSDMDLLEREDVSTGLYPFMLAALGIEHSYNVDTVFHLIKASPKLAQGFGGNDCEEEHRPKKRQRYV